VEGTKEISGTLLHANLGLLFKTNFPSIKIASEIERDLLIDELRESSNFVQTHSVMAKLLKHADFSPVQIEQLLQIAQTNNQVGWIIGDSVVYAFHASLQKHEAKLTSDVAAQLKEHVKKGEPS
jgi:hypothetical protein